MCTPGEETSQNDKELVSAENTRVSFVLKWGNYKSVEGESSPFHSGRLLSMGALTSGRTEENFANKGEAKAQKKRCFKVTSQFPGAHKL